MPCQRSQRNRWSSWSGRSVRGPPDNIITESTNDSPGLSEVGGSSNRPQRTPLEKPLQGRTVLYLAEYHPGMLISGQRTSSAILRPVIVGAPPTHSRQESAYILVRRDVFDGITSMTGVVFRPEPSTATDIQRSTLITSLGPTETPAYIRQGAAGSARERLSMFWDLTEEEAEEEYADDYLDPDGENRMYRCSHGVRTTRPLTECALPSGSLANFIVARLTNFSAQMDDPDNRDLPGPSY